MRTACGGRTWRADEQATCHAFVAPEAAVAAPGKSLNVEVPHEVYKLTGKLFAIKWLLPKLSERPDAIQRFMREAQVGGQVEHVNVVEVYDVGQDGSSYYMVMELIRGETVAPSSR